MKETSIVVLGAGMIGVSVAWHLARRGHQVTLVDRRSPGQETSFGNAGLIQREAIEPHPFPRAWSDILRILPNRAIDVRYRLPAMVREAQVLWRYWRASAPQEFERIAQAYASLIVHCTDDHQVMIEASGADALIDRRGWLQVYRSQDTLIAGIVEADAAQRLQGVEFETCDRLRLRELEPALRDEAVGAIWWENAWSVNDPGGLVDAYARSFVAGGGQFVESEVLSMDQSGSGWTLRLRNGTLAGEVLVLAAGPWSIAMLRNLGYTIPMFVQRGYHMHYESVAGAPLNFPVFDHDRGYTLAPKSLGIRLTTGAELAQVGDVSRTGQLAAAERAAREIFPLGRRKDAHAWRGARPCIADMKPVIGPAHHHKNLWFAFGHGHQGFTLGPTTGRLLAAMMAGEPTSTDMSPFRADRFGS